MTDLIDIHLLPACISPPVQSEKDAKLVPISTAIRHRSVHHFQIICENNSNEFMQINIYRQCMKKLNVHVLMNVNKLFLVFKIDLPHLESVFIARQ